MIDWCVTRNMSWECVGYLCQEHSISFEELPVAGDTFLDDLAQVSRRKEPFLPILKREKIS